jgi:RNA polymerase sigma-70 factor (ECF subfamily)
MVPTNGSSASLLERLRHVGSRADWERFVNLFSPLLEHWARGLCRPDESADLVQDVLVLVMQKLPTFAGDGDRSFAAWLRAIMVNRAHELWRRSASRPCIANTAMLETVVGNDAGPGEVDATDYREFLIRRALQIMQCDFEVRTWQACWEHVAADRPAADVAAELGVSADVVYRASYKVIHRLRTELAGAWG